MKPSIDSEGAKAVIGFLSSLFRLTTEEETEELVAHKRTCDNADTGLYVYYSEVNKGWVMSLFARNNGDDSTMRCQIMDGFESAVHAVEVEKIVLTAIANDDVEYLERKLSRVIFPSMKLTDFISEYWHSIFTSRFRGAAGEARLAYKVLTHILGKYWMWEIDTNLIQSVFKEWLKIGESVLEEDDSEGMRAFLKRFFDIVYDIPNACFIEACKRGMMRDNPLESLERLDITSLLSNN